MADALCGPSNSLQSLHKHTSVDRTLQQERLATHKPPTEGFRSTSGLNTGVLDAEFEAFQWGNSLDNRLIGHEAFAFREASTPFRPELDRSGDPGWASDFSKLYINGQPQPIPQSQFREQASLNRGSQSGWHNEFLRQQNRASVQHTRQQIPSAHRQPLPSDHTYGVFDEYMDEYTPLSRRVQQVRPTRELNDVFDDAALERAFDAVNQELKQPGDILRGGGIEYGQDSVLLKDTIEKPVHLSGSRGALLDEPIGSDTILDETDKEAQGNNEADELARTAGELLDSVKHDQSQKFRQSNFLSLMRQLRDREVQIEGDKIVDIAQPLHPGGEFYPEGMSGQSESQQGLEAT